MDKNVVKHLVKQVTPRATSAVSKVTPTGSPMMVLDAFNLLVTKHHEYQVIASQEQTKRAFIQSWETTRLEELRCQKEIVQNYLEKSFTERREVISSLFERYDQAMESGNINAAGQILGVITDTVKASPLNDIEKLMADVKDSSIKHIDF